MGKAAGRSASEPRGSLETEREGADPVVRRGRPLPEGAERTPTLRIFRGSRGGMWRKSHRAGRETHDGAGAELATKAYKGHRNR